MSFHGSEKTQSVNPFSTNPTKWSYTLKQLVSEVGALRVKY